MKNLIIIGVIGIVIFGASFASSTFLLQKDDEAETTEDANEQDSTSDDEFKVSNPMRSGKEGSKTTLPVPFKPKTLTDESVLKMVESIQDRETDVIEREKEILDRESRHRFILKDIQREKREYEAVVQQVQAKIEQAKQLLQTVEKRKMEIVAEQKKIELMQAEIEKRSTPQALTEQKNVKKIADWIGSMPAEDAANTFKRYANDGKLIMAARILRQIEERTAAKILTAMNDPVLVTQLLDEFKNSLPNQPPNKQRK